MSKRFRLGDLGDTDPLGRSDGNQDTYDPLRDARGDTGAVQWWRMDRIEASPYQVRRVFNDIEIEDLADSILASGLIHPPKGRPHPTKPGWVQLMPGEMRFRAMQRLVSRDDAAKALRRDGEGHWLMPILVEEVTDDAADEMVLRENLDRTDLSHWEWALAFRDRRERLRARGKPARVEDVAAEFGRKKTQMNEYLKVADHITLGVLLAAGVVTGGEPDHRRLAPLTLAALTRVAGVAARRSVELAATTLLRELNQVGDVLAAEAIRELQSTKKRTSSAAEKGFQLNIRNPLDKLPPQRAVHFLGKMLPALGTLAERAAAASAAQRKDLAKQLEAMAERLRRG